jgi:hypothetical protein
MHADLTDPAGALDDTGEVPLAPEVALLVDDEPGDHLPDDLLHDLPEPDGEPESETEPSGVDASANAIDGSDVEPGSAPARAASGRTRRASVPSWDDIMFGAKRD